MARPLQVPSTRTQPPVRVQLSSRRASSSASVSRCGRSISGPWSVGTPSPAVRSRGPSTGLPAKATWPALTRQMTTASRPGRMVRRAATLDMRRTLVLPDAPTHHPGVRRGPSQSSRCAARAVELPVRSAVDPSARGASASGRATLRPVRCVLRRASCRWRSRKGYEWPRTRRGVAGAPRQAAGVPAGGTRRTSRVPGSGWRAPSGRWRSRWRNASGCQGDLREMRSGLTGGARRPGALA